MRAVIFDLDGTIANVEHRRPFITGEEKDWKSFNESCGMDTPNEWAVNLVRNLRNFYRIVIVTGRSADFLDVTTEWLQKHGIQYDQLAMRMPGDYRKDNAVKKEIYEAYIKPYYDVEFCVDDRQQVVDMWRSLGLVCLQCDVGDF